MTRKNRIIQLLHENFSPLDLWLDDDSARHAGHAGAQPEGESHFKLFIVSAKFESLNRIARHRLINHALQPEFDSGLHALNIRALTPQEAASIQKEKG